MKAAGETAGKLRRFDEAEAFVVRALAIEEQAFGATDASVADTLSQLALAGSGTSAVLAWAEADDRELRQTPEACARCCPASRGDPAHQA